MTLTKENSVILVYTALKETNYATLHNTILFTVDILYIVLLYVAISRVHLHISHLANILFKISNFSGNLVNVVHTYVLFYSAV